MTELARMVAIEGLDNGFLKTFLRRKLDEHVQPGDRLEDGPMQPNRKDQGDSNSRIFEPPQHSERTIQWPLEGVN